MLSMETNQRKNLALWMMFGGAFIFTGYASVSLWLVKSTLSYVFWLGVIAHIQIFSIMAGFIALLVKRRIQASKDGVSIVDDGMQQSGYSSESNSSISEPIHESTSGEVPRGD